MTALICECCGGRINPTTLICEYCDTAYGIVKGLSQTNTSINDCIMTPNEMREKMGLKKVNDRPINLITKNPITLTAYDLCGNKIATFESITEKEALYNRALAAMRNYNANY